MFKWSSLSPDAFEALCAEILERCGFSNIEWFGKGGGDKGRDLIATRTHEPLPGTQRMDRWVVQCKRYSKKRLSKTDVDSFLVSAKEHRPDAVLLIVTATLTADVRDWVKSIKSEYAFDIMIWEERDLEREIRRHREHLSLIPEIAPQANTPIQFYPLTPNSREFMCNEIDEVGFFIMNCGSVSEDVERIRSFIEFIRHNEVSFDAPDMEEDD